MPFKVYTVPNAQKIIPSRTTSIAHRTYTQTFPGGFPTLPRTGPGVGRVFILFLHHLEVVSSGCDRFSRRRNGRGTCRYRRLYLHARREDHAGTSDIRDYIVSFI